jgi:hypothetical protein
MLRLILNFAKKLAFKRPRKAKKAYSQEEKKDPSTVKSEEERQLICELSKKIENPNYQSKILQDLETNYKKKNRNANWDVFFKNLKLASLIRFLPNQKLAEDLFNLTRDEPELMFAEYIAKGELLALNTEPPYDGFSSDEEIYDAVEKISNAIVREIYDSYDSTNDDFRNLLEDNGYTRETLEDHCIQSIFNHGLKKESVASDANIENLDILSSYYDGEYDKLKRLIASTKTFKTLMQYLDTQGQQHNWVPR